MIDTVSSSIIYKEKEYKLVFNLNVMEAIQDEYETLDKWGSMTDGSQGEPNIKALLFGFQEMLNEGIEIANEDNGTNEPLLTHKQVARIVTEVGMKNVSKKIDEVVIASAGDTSKNE